MNTDNTKEPPQTSSTSTMSTVRVQSPDVIVAVGSGDNMQEFECYKINLSFAAEYFDIMLSSGMVEDTISKISFPDKVCHLYYMMGLLYMCLFDVPSSYRRSIPLKHIIGSRNMERILQTNRSITDI